MAKYVVFYDLSTGYDGPKKLIEVCGDRGVIRVDARLNYVNIIKIAYDECAKRKFKAWRLFKGDSLLTAKPITEIHVLTGDTK